jgi:hypothetical protein
MASSMLSKLATGFRTFFGIVAASLAVCATGQVSVTTYHNDNLRTGLNASETILTPANVNPTNFGLLFSLPVDGQVYAQPLYVPNLTIPGKGVHNVVFIATEHNSLFAYDADSNLGANAQPLWQDNFGPSVPNGYLNSSDINPEIGITGTPVIGSNATYGPLIYLISKTQTFDTNGNPIYTQKLHAIQASTGKEELGGPVVVQGSVPGTGDGSSGGTVAFNPLIQNNRAALLLVDTARFPGGELIVPYASHGDNGPYHGWVFAYNASNLALIRVVNTTPNATTDASGYPLAAGGIWQGGFGPATDGHSIFYATGNGTFNPSNGSYGDSVVRLDANFFIGLDYFSPADQLSLDDYDTDLGSGGVMLLPRSASGNQVDNFAVQCGKEGSIYLLDTSNLGHNGATDNVTQELNHVMGGIWGGPAYFNNTIYFGPIYSSIVSFGIANGRFTQTTPTGYTSTYFQYPGTVPAVSANGITNGIVWAIQTDGFSSGQPAILHAYAATNVANELYNTTLTQGRDVLGPAVKFAVPTVVNGKVYVGAGGSVGVFGLGAWAANPVVVPASGSYSPAVRLIIQDPTPGAVVYYTTDGSTPTTSSTKYTRPISLNTSTTLKLRAYLANGTGASAVIERDYLVNSVVGTGTGLFGAYYNNSQNAGGTPTATEIDPTINFNWNGNSPINGVAGSNWAGEWTGQIQALTTGTYTLTTNSDDGVQVYINGQLLINDYTYHAPTLDSATVSFQAGQKYNIDIKYFQGGGGSLLQLFWAAPGLPMEIVPQTQLYPGN